VTFAKLAARGGLDPIGRAWAVLTGAESVRLAFGLVSSLLIARALGPADYGMYAVLAAMVGIVGVLAEGGLSEAAVLRMAPTPVATQREQGRAFFWLRLSLATGVVAVLCLLAGPLASILGIKDDGALTRWALLGVVATAASGAVSVLLQAARRFGEMSLLTLVNTGLTAVLALALWLAGALNIATALVVLGIGTSLATFVVGLRQLRWRPCIPSLPRLRAEGRQLLRTGRWLWLAALLAMLAVNLDVLIVNRFSAPATVGAYALAVNLASKTSVVNYSLYTVLLPGVAELDDAAAVKSYLKRATLRSTVVALILAACIPLAGPFVLLVYGAEFAPAIGLLQLLVGVVIFDLLLTPLLLVPLAYRRARVLAAADGARALTLALVGTALVPSLGPIGVVAARFASRLAGAVLVIAALGRAPFEVQHEEPARVS
jgi:PST family polysaccharide transporter